MHQRHLLFFLRSFGCTLNTNQHKILLDYERLELPNSPDVAQFTCCRQEKRKIVLDLRKTKSSENLLTTLESVDQSGSAAVVVPTPPPPSTLPAADERPSEESIRVRMDAAAGSENNKETSAAAEAAAATAAAEAAAIKNQKLQEGIEKHLKKETKQASATNQSHQKEVTTITTYIRSSSIRQLPRVTFFCCYYLELFIG